jgi:hypothetical protein
VPGENLCDVLSLGSLIRVTGMPLQAGTFVGKTCVLGTKDGSGQLTLNVQRARGITDYINHLKSIGGVAVTVAGADNAAAITIPSGTGSRIGLVAKIGNVSLNVSLTGKHISVDQVAAIAELITGA